MLGKNRNRGKESMTIYGKDGEQYNTVAEAEKADAEFDARELAKKQEQERIANVRKDRANAIQAKMQKRDELEEEISKDIAAFVNDYGSFRYNSRSQNRKPLTVYDVINLF